MRINILLSAVIGACTLSMAWFAQLYFTQLQMPMAMFGVLWTALNLVVGLFSWLAHKIEDRFTPAGTVFIIVAILPLCYLLAAYNIGYFGVAVIFVFYAIRGIATPVLKDYVNRIAPTQSRATVLSARSFIIRIAFAILGPIFGLIINVYSLQLAMCLAGIMFLIAGAFLFRLFQKHAVPNK
ncbi:MAG: MFS transporter [Bacteroidales bacterium]|nr:MFS transporter [Bacteroidales bacterium]